MPTRSESPSSFLSGVISFPPDCQSSPNIDIQYKAHWVFFVKNIGNQLSIILNEESQLSFTAHVRPAHTSQDSLSSMAELSKELKTPMYQKRFKMEIWDLGLLLLPFEALDTLQRTAVW